MNLIENVINRNEEDMKRINLLIKSLDKLKSKEVAGRINNILIEETLRLADMNKQLKEYLEWDNQKISKEIKDEK